MSILVSQATKRGGCLAERRQRRRGCEPCERRDGPVSTNDGCLERWLSRARPSALLPSWALLSPLRMFLYLWTSTNVYERLRTSTNVYERLRTSTNVCGPLRTSTDLYVQTAISLSLALSLPIPYTLLDLSRIKAFQGFGMSVPTARAQFLFAKSSSPVISPCSVLRRRHRS